MLIKMPRLEEKSAQIMFVRGYLSIIAGEFCRYLPFDFERKGRR